MQNFEIRRTYSHKGWTFCMSVVSGNAFWSTHKGVFDIQQARRHAQRSHNEQILSLIQEKLRASANPEHSITN